MDTKKKLPIGIEYFDEMITEDFYYIDKTGLIRDFLQQWTKVSLFMRPKRSGKSLNMHMFQYFFEYGCNPSVFDGLEISSEGALCKQFMGQFPVISISLKDVSGKDYGKSVSQLASIIGKEASRFYFLKDSRNLNELEKEQYKRLIFMEPGSGNLFSIPENILADSLQILSHLLHKHYGKKVILLIDDYDVPQACAYQNGYYEEMASLINSLYSAVLKNNPSLQFSILTGCLCLTANASSMSWQSILGGLHNIRIFSLQDTAFCQYFGFTKEEAMAMLNDFGLSEANDTIDAWYGGYLSGNKKLYCPWDLIDFLSKLRQNKNAVPETFWAHSHSNDLMVRFIRNIGIEQPEEIERLISFESVQKNVHRELSCRELDPSTGDLWDILYAMGGLAADTMPENGQANLIIPNKCIHQIFLEQATKMLGASASADSSKLYRFCQGFMEQEIEMLQNQLHEYFKEHVCILDTCLDTFLKEQLYHSYLLELLKNMRGAYVTSQMPNHAPVHNIMIEDSYHQTGIIIGVRYAADGDMDAACRTALWQIEEQEYESFLESRGMTYVIKYGIGCWNKRCLLLLG